MRTARLVTASTAVFVALLGGAVAAHASTSSGAALTGNCNFSATSTGSDNATLSTMTGPATASPSNPFVLDLNGTVTYQGTSGTAIHNHHWYVDVYGIQVMSGGSPNSKSETKANGTVVVKNVMPIQITGLYYANGAIQGSYGSCTGDGWLLLAGNPTGSLPWILALILIVLGFVGLVTALPQGRAA